MAYVSAALFCRCSLAGRQRSHPLLNKSGFWGLFGEDDDCDFRPSMWGY